MERIYHTWDKWECYPAGFYETRPPVKGMTDEEARDEFAAFLGDPARFGRGLDRVLAEWPHSCEHYLTNERMNRIAWLGQAAACIEMGLPSRYRAGYFRLTPEQQAAADGQALYYLNVWLVNNGAEPVDMAGAASKTQMDLY